MKRVVVGITGVDEVGRRLAAAITDGIRRDKALHASVIGLCDTPPPLRRPLAGIRRFPIPSPEEGETPLLGYLSRLHHAQRLEVVIPTRDTEIPLYIRLRERLARIGVRTFLPEAHQWQLCDRRHLAQSELALARPPQAVVACVSELLDTCERFAFPLLVKGPRRGTHRADHLEAALNAFSRVVGDSGYPVVVQRHIAGTPASVVGIGDGTGGTPALAAVRRRRDGVGIEMVDTATAQPLLTAASRFVALSRWRGAFELRFAVAQSGPLLLAVRAGFPVGVERLTGVGINLPATLVRCACGATVEARAPDSLAQRQGHPHP